jgi:hypothetical protein
LSANAGEVLTVDAPSRRVTLTVTEDGGHHCWQVGGFLRGGLVSGPGFRVYADDWPPGTRLVVSAQIEVCKP